MKFYSRRITGDLWRIFSTHVFMRRPEMGSGIRSQEKRLGGTANYENYYLKKNLNEIFLYYQKYYLFTTHTTTEMFPNIFLEFWILLFICLYFFVFTKYSSDVLCFLFDFWKRKILNRGCWLFNNFRYHKYFVQRMWILYIYIFRLIWKMRVFLNDL